MKPGILFVGAFVDKGVKGGQLFACRTLVDGPLKDAVEWDLVDTTMESLPPPPLRRRAWLAANRLIKFTWKLVWGRHAAVIIFSDAGLGFAEKGLMAQLAACRGRPVIYSLRSGYIKESVERSRRVRWWLRRVLGATSGVACQGVAWKEFFKTHTGLPETRFRVIMNAIDTTPYLNVPELSEARDEVRVLFAGWIDCNKGVYDLVRAAQLGRDSLSNVRFAIAGDGPELEGMRQAVISSGLEERFEFYGWVDQKAKLKLLKECDFLVLPSHREGLPNIVLEALASARPVVATRVGAVPEVVRDGISGMLCDPGSPESLLSALIRMSETDSRRAMGVAGRADVIENNDSSAQWRKWHALLKDIGVPLAE